jgi:PAS domain S-box-containing protein
MSKSVTDSRLMHGPDGDVTGAGVWRVVLLYAGFATAWILFSDLLVSALFSDPRDIERASIAKGWLFVLVTALLLLVHLSRHAARIERRDAQLRAITLQAGDAIGVVDAAMHLQFVNPAACELTGYTHGELIGKSLPDLMPEDARNAITGYLPGLIEGVVRRDEWPLIRKDGRRLRVDVTAQRLADGRYLGIVRDITERKRVESLVENERLRMQTLIRRLPDMVWLKDPQGVFLLCNPAFEACSGFAEAGILGKTDYDLVSAEKADEFRESDLRALSSDRPVSFEQWVDSAGRGRRMLMQVTKSRVFDAEGSVIGVLGVGRDVTEDREARRVLRDRLELQAMLANIAASAPGVIFSFRLQPDGRAQMPYASPKIEQVTGITAQALARDVAPLWALLHPEDVARLDRSVRDSAHSMGAW